MHTASTQAMVVPSPPHLQACPIMTCNPTPRTQKISTTWGPLAAPRTNHGLNPMFDKQTSLMDASCRRGDKQARRPSYNLLGGLSGRAANYLWASSPNRMRAPGTAATYQFSRTLLIEAGSHAAPPIPLLLYQNSEWNMPPEPVQLQRQRQRGRVREGHSSQRLGDGEDCRVVDQAKLRTTKNVDGSFA